MSLPLSLKNITQNKIPYLFGLPASDSAVPEDMSAEFVNTIQNEIAGMPFIRQSHLLVDYQDYTVSGTRDAQTLPRNFASSIGICEVQSNTESSPRDLINPAQGAGLRNTGYQLLGTNDIVFVELGSATYRLYYRRTPPALHYGSTVTHDATTINFSAEVGSVSYLDDYYNRSDLYVISGGSIAGSVVPISDYDGGGAQATVTWIDTPTTGASVEYSILSFLPPMWHSLLVYGAASLYTAKFPSIASRHEARYYRMLQEFEDWISEQDEATPEFANMDSLYPEYGGL